MSTAHAIPQTRLLTAALAAALAAGVTPASPQDPGAGRPAEARDTTAPADPSLGSIPDTVELPDLVVTATRVPLHRDALPTPVTVLSGEALRAAGVRDVAEALARVPGAALVRTGAPGAQTSLFLRGGESDYVKVLVDGVPVNDPGGAVDLADLALDQVERIEVVRGPVSVLYGSDAVSGVVQVFTRRGAGPARVTASLAGGRGEQRYREGSYGLVDGSAAVSGGAGALSYALGATRSWSEGPYPLNSERGLTTTAGRLAWTPRPGAELAVNARLSDSRAGFPTDGTGALVDANARIDRRRWTTSVEGGLRLHPRVDARVRLGLAARRQDSRDRADGPADTLDVYASDLHWDVLRRTANARLNIDLPRSVLTGGVALDRSTAGTRYASESQWGPTRAAAEYERRSAGYYIQLLAEPADGLHLTAGGRVDRSRTFGAFGTWRLGLAARLLPGTRVRAAAGRGFREPALDESFGSGFGDRGNPDLEPERSDSWEVGVEQRVGPHLHLAATWFDQRFRDLIQFTFAPPAPEDPNYFNVGAARARGLELETGVSAGRLGVSASYTWLDTEVLDPGLATDAAFARGLPLLRRPARSGSLGAHYRHLRGRLAATLHVTGEREDLDFAAGFPAPRATLPPHATLDLAAEHALPLGAAPRTDLVLRARNLLDAAYEAALGFPAPGRVVQLGVRLRM